MICFAFLVNKRLDEWVDEKRLDPGKVFFPKKVQPSRPSSPFAGDVAPTLPLTATSSNTPALKKKKQGQKRPFDEVDRSLPPTPAPSPGPGPATPISVINRIDIKVVELFEYETRNYLLIIVCIYY